MGMSLLNYIDVFIVIGNDLIFQGDCLGSKY